MPATAEQTRANAHLTVAQRVKRERFRLRSEVRALPFGEGCYLLADALAEMPDWLEGQDVLTMLAWPAGMGVKGRRGQWDARGAAGLYALTDARGRYRLRELTPRQRDVLAGALRNAATERPAARAA